MTQNRVLRCGSWYNVAANCRSAFQIAYAPTLRSHDVGFRVCFCLQTNSLSREHFSMTTMTEAILSGENDLGAWGAWLDEQEYNGEWGPELTLARHTHSLLSGWSSDEEKIVQAMLLAGVKPLHPTKDVCGITFALIPHPEKSYWVSIYPITQSQWRQVIKTEPSNFKGDNLPVEEVTWHDAMEFCKRLSEMAGECISLPTSEEWEYACRAGTRSDYNTGDGEESLSAAGWYLSNSGSRTHPVGEKVPNAFGLYDMHGNVWEWCCLEADRINLPFAVKSHYDQIEGVVIEQAGVDVQQASYLDTQKQDSVTQDSDSASEEDSAESPFGGFEVVPTPPGKNTAVSSPVLEVSYGSHAQQTASASEEGEHSSDPTGCAGAVAGAARPGAADRRIASGARRRSGTRISVFDSVEGEQRSDPIGCTGYSGAAVGFTAACTAGRRTAVGTHRGTRTATWASASEEGSEQNQVREIRGGSWLSYAEWCRSGYHRSNHSLCFGHALGFRLTCHV